MVNWRKLAAFAVSLRRERQNTSKDAVPIARTTAGQIVRMATVEPRVFVLTFGVDF